MEWLLVRAPADTREDSQIKS